MADINSSDGFPKSRAVLGEITNLPTKRGFLDIEDRGVKRSKLSESQSVKRSLVEPNPCTDVRPMNKNLLNLSNDNSDAKLFGLGFDFSVGSTKECNGNKFTDVPHFGGKAAECHAFKMDEHEVCSPNFDGPYKTGLGAGRAALKMDGVQNIVMMKSNDVSTAAEVLTKGKTGVNLINPAMGDALELASVETSDKFGESCHVPADSSRTVSENGGDGSGFHGGNELDAYESKVIHTDYHTDGDDHGADNFYSIQMGSTDCMILPESQESRVFGVETPIETKKREECADGNDSVKACSCSFCSKAAYIWLDVNYQDMKERISAMKKSQKNATTLAEQTTWHKTIDKHGAESYTGPVVSDLAGNLMHRWRSLFQGVGDLLKEEINHLEARLQPLTELRGKHSDGTNAALAGQQ
ncbi:uncharacterized protein LOC127242418 [Andrographis paniculata]|uniref:uncharacterized protein LOC127242418 n=1 Tax=Andrographis paniculata TaxID=175694 RepID=UPI0021E960F7|nr:uncharacterized protein LOC127242418 [Andrographis paniculata]XP_051117915.1 uncharacterized protein LOC127242418 [Andrographis paniculata]